MKKIAAIALFLTFIFSYSTNAQGDLNFGVHVSPSFNSINSDERSVSGNSSNLGLRLGLIGEYYFKENYAVTSGIGFAFGNGGTLLYDYSGKYWTETTDLSPSVDTIPANANFKHRISYVEIPIGLKLRTREFGHIRGYAEPFLAIGIRSKAIGDLTATGIEEKDLNIKKEVSPLALNWGIGFGGEYSVSTATVIFAGLQYQRTFTDITADNGVIYNPDRGDLDNKVKVFGNSIVVKIGVKF